MLFDVLCFSIALCFFDCLSFLTNKISKNLLTPLEEARIVIEEFVVLKKVIVDLVPRTTSIRKLQHELVLHYQLKSLSVGTGQNRRLRIYPRQ